MSACPLWPTFLQGSELLASYGEKFWATGGTAPGCSGAIFVEVAHAAADTPGKPPVGTADASRSEDGEGEDEEEEGEEGEEGEEEDEGEEGDDEEVKERIQLPPRMCCVCNEGQGHGDKRHLYTCDTCKQPVHGALVGCSSKGGRGDYASSCVCKKCLELREGSTKQTPKVHTTYDHTTSLRES